MRVCRPRLRLLLLVLGVAGIALLLLLAARLRGGEPTSSRAGADTDAGVQVTRPRLEGSGERAGTAATATGEAPADDQEPDAAPTGRITGRVATEAGRPAPSVVVAIQPEADPVPAAWFRHVVRDVDFAEVETDAEGRFAFEGLPPGRYRLWVCTERAWHGYEVREHVEAGAEGVAFVVPESERHFDVSLCIRVVGPDDLPVPYAQVRLWGGGASLGTYAHRGEDTEIALEQACAPVRLLVWNALDDANEPLGYGPVLVEGVRTQDETLVVRMEPGEEVSGHVVWHGVPTTWTLRASTYGQADGGWGTLWEDSDAPCLSLRTQTDADGRFRFRGLPRGRAAIDLAASEVSGRLRDGGALVEVPSTGVRLEAVPTGALHVVVRAPEGERLRSADVRVLQWVEGGARRAWAAQTSTGQKSKGHPELSFDAPGLETDGRFRIVAYGSFASGRRGGPAVLDDVRIQDEPCVVDLTPGPRIAGRIVDAQGRPIARVAIHPRVRPGGGFRPWEWNPSGVPVGSVQTDDYGRFVLFVPRGGSYLLALDSGRWTLLPDPPVVRPGDEDVRIVARPARRITGRVCDAAGAPVEGFHAAGVPANGVPALWSPTRVTADGFFAVPVGPGRWRVSVWSAEDPRDLRCALSAPVEAGATDLRLALEPSAALAGRVRDDRGRPVGGARVWVQGPHVNRRAETEDDGSFLVHGLPPGRYEVFVRTPDGAEHTIPAAVTAVGELTALDLSLPR